LLLLGFTGEARSNPSTILSLGEDRYLPKARIEGSTGTQFIKELEGKKLEEVQMIILSNADYRALPAPIREGLVEYVKKGGVLLVTGGDRSYGSGGYGKADLAGILPFTILHPRDWAPTRRGQIEPVAANHPVFSGVDFRKMPYVGTFNNLGPGEGSTLIAQLSILYRQPLIAERSAGNGLVFGITFDMNEISSQWAEEDLFCLNLIRYLLKKSVIQPR
jgi:uncharacterized membrane protein